MASEDTKGLRKKNGRKRSRRRKELEQDDSSDTRISGAWGMASLGQESLADFILRRSGHLYLFCRSGSPGFADIGGIGFETLYSDIDFGYVSEITRKQKRNRFVGKFASSAGISTMKPVFPMP